MSIFVYLLIGIHMSGALQPLYMFQREVDCKTAIVEAQTIAKKPAHLTCLKLLINEV